MPADGCRSASAASDANPAIDDERLTGGEARLIAGKVDRDIGDLLYRAEAAHRLTGNELLHRELEVAGRAHALLQRRRRDGSRADGVAADPALDEISGNG